MNCTLIHGMCAVCKADGPNSRTSRHRVHQADSLSIALHSNGFLHTPLFSAPLEFIWATNVAKNTSCASVTTGLVEKATRLTSAKIVCGGADARERSGAKHRLVCQHCH